MSRLSSAEVQAAPGSGAGVVVGLVDVGLADFGSVVIEWVGVEVRVFVLVADGASDGVLAVEEGACVDAGVGGAEGAVLAVEDGDCVDGAGVEWSVLRVGLGEAAVEYGIPGVTR